MSNRETQNDELLALQSIYDEKYFIVEHNNPPSGRFLAHIELPESFRIQLKSSNDCCSSESSSSDAVCEEFEVSHLPPINVHFEYPESYPSDSPPAFLLSCSWLTYDQLCKLCKYLDSLWRENNGEVILFQWMQFLKHETFSFLQIKECLDITELSKYNLKDVIKNNLYYNSSSHCGKSTFNDKNNQRTEIHSITSLVSPKLALSGGNGDRDCRAFLDIADGKVLKSMLKNYNEYKKRELFNESWHCCNICYASKLGCDFVKFQLCQHFFCKDCVKSYFELMINQGNIKSLNCPCDKCTTQADGTLVKQIVSKDYFERYDSLLLSRTLETMSDVAYCPRKFCQCPLLIDIAERIASCPKCKFVFCPFCKKTYHGVAPCNFDPALKKQIFDDYLKGDDFRKAEIENRLGKRLIKSLVDEVLTEQWLDSNSKSCPHCNVSIEKTEGCNKMVCYKCGTSFCWLCNKQLNASNPYNHFQDEGTECFNRLFPPEYLEEQVFEPGEFLNF